MKQDKQLEDLKKKMTPEDRKFFEDFVGKESFGFKEEDFEVYYPCDEENGK